MNVYIFINYGLDSVEAQPVTAEDTNIIASTSIDELMGGATCEIVTKRGGYHDTCDILDTMAVPWHDVPDYQKDEMVKAEAKAWAKRQGFIVEAVEFI